MFTFAALGSIFLLVHPSSSSNFSSSPMAASRLDFQKFFIKINFQSRSLWSSGKGKGLRRQQVSNSIYMLRILLSLMLCFLVVFMAPDSIMTNHLRGVGSVGTSKII